MYHTETRMGLMSQCPGTVMLARAATATARARAKLRNVSTAAMAVLGGKADPFGGVTVDVGSEVENARDAPAFASRLQESLAHWSSEGKRGIWLRVPSTHSTLVGAAVDQGFEFHHCQPTYVMLTKWLPTHEESRLPGYATHYIGIGGFVLNDQNEVLVVQEKYRVGGRPHWKLPGGLVEAGESLAAAAVREVTEETGIATRFEGLISVREKFDYKWGRDDLYFVALLRPVADETIRRCSRELDACEWMKLEEYIASDIVNPTNKHVAACVLESVRSNSGVLTAESVLAYTMKSYNTVYSALNGRAKQYLLTDPLHRNREPYPWYEDERQPQ